MLPIKKQISNYNHSTGNTKQYIVIHDTGNYIDSDENNAKYFCEGDRNSSAHYFVDEDSITQIVEDDMASWHCGDGGDKYGIGNHNSIGIEMCNDYGIILDQTINNTLDLIRSLMKKYNINADHVVRHYDASRKNCPQNLNKDGKWGGWINFKNKLVNKVIPTPTVKIDQYGIVTASVLNVRNKASVDSVIIGKLNKGDKVKLGRKTGNWYDIYFGNSGGYISADYIKLI
jgi:N-acetylmuramoyl-L-alanine amidase